jgi:hypothetical protein
MTRWLVTCGALLAMEGATHAHHSIAGYYDTSRDVTIEGIVSQFRFVQPHPFLVVDVRRGSTAEQWQLELDNRWELTEIGITETTLKPGDRIVVSGSPARREPQQLYVQRLNRPADGFGFEQVGNRPRLRKSAR